MANSVDPDQTAPSGAVWSGSSLFAYVILSETLGFRIFRTLISVTQGKKKNLFLFFGWKNTVLWIVMMGITVFILSIYSVESDQMLHCEASDEVIDCFLLIQQFLATLAGVVKSICPKCLTCMERISGESSVPNFCSVVDFFFYNIYNDWRYRPDYLYAGWYN